MTGRVRLQSLELPADPRRGGCGSRHGTDDVRAQREQRGGGVTPSALAGHHQVADPQTSLDGVQCRGDQCRFAGAPALQVIARRAMGARAPDEHVGRIELARPLPCLSCECLAGQRQVLRSCLARTDPVVAMQEHDRPLVRAARETRGPIAHAGFAMVAGADPHGIGERIALRAGRPHAAPQCLLGEVAFRGHLQRRFGDARRCAGARDGCEGGGRGQRNRDQRGREPQRRDPRRRRACPAHASRRQ